MSERTKKTLEPMLSEFNGRSGEILAEEEIKVSLKEWGRYTLLNTIGQLLVASGSTYAGVEEGKLAFALDVERCSITLYDDAEGNGACELFIATIRFLKLREPKRRNACTSTSERRFCQHPEQEFLTCEEHIANRALFELAQGSSLEGVRLKPELRAQADSLNQRYQSLWDQLSVRSVQRGSVQDCASHPTGTSSG